MLLCGKQRVLQTTDLRSKPTLQRQHINNEEEYCRMPVSKYIRLCAVSLGPSFEVFPLYNVFDENQLTLGVKESSVFVRKYKQCLNGNR